jgi:hypothetical protein
VDSPRDEHDEHPVAARDCLLDHLRVVRRSRGPDGLLDEMTVELEQLIVAITS